MTDIVGEYARLSLLADGYVSAGQPIPFHIKQAIDRIEYNAQVTLSPEQMQAAMDHVEAAKQRILGEERAAHGERVDRKIESLVRGDTVGMLGRENGLTPKQLKRVSEGKSIKVKPEYELFDRQAANKRTRDFTKRFDPRGRGYSFKGWEDKLESLVDASDESLERQARDIEADPDELRDVVKNYRDERYEWESRKRRAVTEPPKDEVYEPTDDDQRRATVLKTYYERVDDDDPHQMETFGGTVYADSLDDEGRRGDVARAFMEHDDEQP